MSCQKVILLATFLNLSLQLVLQSEVSGKIIVYGNYIVINDGELTSYGQGNGETSNATVGVVNEKDTSAFNKIKTKSRKMSPDYEDNTELEDLNTGIIPTIRKLTEKEKELASASKGTALGNEIPQLCAEGVDPNIGDVENNSSTALHVAAISGAKRETLMLIRCGGNVNMVDEFGNTPLHWAVRKGIYWVSIILLLNKANPFIRNKNGFTPEDLAVDDPFYSTRKLFHQNVLEWLTDVGELGHFKTKFHRMVKTRNYLGIIDSCMLGINVRYHDEENNQNTPLHLAVNSKASNEETVLTLLHCGADVNAQNGDGNTALHLAIAQGQVNVTIALLINKADPFIPNNLNKTACQLGKESSNDFISDTFINGYYNWYMNHVIDWY